MYIFWIRTLTNTDTHWQYTHSFFHIRLVFNFFANFSGLGWVPLFSFRVTGRFIPHEKRKNEFSRRLCGRRRRPLIKTSAPPAWSGCGSGAALRCLTSGSVLAPSCRGSSDFFSAQHWCGRLSVTHHWSYIVSLFLFQRERERREPS